MGCRWPEFVSEPGEDLLVILRSLKRGLGVQPSADDASELAGSPTLMDTAGPDESLGARGTLPPPVPFRRTIMGLEVLFEVEGS